MSGAKPPIRRKLPNLKGISSKEWAGMPLQYILGFWEFYSLKFFVGEGVLIPRADTETLVQQAINALSGKENPKVLDLCCGSGCVGTAIAKNLKGARLFSADLFDRPLEFTEKNARLNGLSDIHIIRGDVLKGAKSFKEICFNGDRFCEKEMPDDFGNFDLIVSNPPYIRSAVIDTLSKEVKNEPREALDGGGDGLKFYRAICENFKDLLNENGRMMVEIGFDQREEVVEIFKSRFKSTRCMTDLSGNDRVVIAADE